MSVLVSTLYNDVTNVVLENGAFSTLGIMLDSDFYNYLTDVYQDFLSNTGCIKQLFNISIVGGTAIYTEPDTAMEVQMASANNIWLYRSSGWYLDNYSSTWSTVTGVPERWREDGMAAKQIQIEPTPSVSVGNLQLVATAQPSSYPATGSDNFNFIPDSFTPYLKYGVLEKIFSEDGEYKDTDRANYCRQIYLMGVKMVASIMTEVGLDK